MPKALERIRGFALGVREEMKQVTWPTRDELLGSALVVFVGVAILAMLISAWDFVLSWAARQLLR
ncbi:MAG: preprotein translocase subunit SecE [Candidatus Omnitrophica bacterium]|nr:preprotein translocase subunit SecE [Candidatus Omnitrophota bacterium]